MLGGVLLEQNNLIEAERALLHGLDLIGWTINPYYQMTACVALFRLREIQRRSAEALQFLNRLDEMWPDVGFCTQALRVLHSLRTAPDDPDKLAAAASWCQAFSSSLGDDVPPPGMGPLGTLEAYYLARLVWARTHVAIGKPQPALAYLERQLCLAKAHSLVHRVIELSLVQAQAWQALGQIKRASEALEHALTLAEPEGYLRIFDQGPALSRLLVEAAHHGIARDYIGHIMEAIGSPPSFRGEQADKPAPSGMLARCGESLVEKLSERELEVLRLMARGASNQDIAEQLVVTIGTVKSHINHILVKMDAHNRTEAVAKARQLDLKI